LVRQPFGLQCSWAWTLCAAVATAATIPLAASWMLSVPAVWEQLERLDTLSRQDSAVCAPIAVAAAILFTLDLLGDTPVARGAAGIALLLLTAPLILLASNSGPVKVGTQRRWMVLRASLAALTCLAMSCIELHAIGDPRVLGELRPSIELLSASFLAAMALLSFLAALRNQAKQTDARPSRGDVDEIDVPSNVGLALLEGERVHEFARLRRQEISEEKVHRTEADWSAGMVSTLSLPKFTENELETLCGDPAQPADG
jgi:hypothetical protein